MQMNSDYVHSLSVIQDPRLPKVAIALKNA